MWGFGEGIALRGLLAASKTLSDADSYKPFVADLLETYVSRAVGSSNEEHVAPGTELLEVYEDTGDIHLLEAAKRLAALNASFPKNTFGARMHRNDLPGWREQIWVDCMDVDAPFLVQLGNITGDDSYIEQGVAEILGYACALQEESGTEHDGLYWHGYESNCGRNGQLWARGNGWAVMGLVETLKLLPDAHQSRTELTDRLNRLCLALKRVQHSDGLWHTVVTEPETYLESTLAVMVAFALREAFEAGLLDSDLYGDMERNARSAATGCINDRGELTLVSDATPIGCLKMYATRPCGIFPWGQGPLLLMLAQTPL